MMGRPGTWALGLAVSALAHLGLGAALMAALQPQDIPDQPRAKSNLQVTPEVVTRSDAAQQAPESTDVISEDGESTTLGAGAVATSTAKAQDVKQPRTKAAAPATDTATAARLPEAQAAPKADTAIRQTALTPPSDTQRAKAPPTNAAQPSAPETTVTQPGDISGDQPLRATKAVSQMTPASQPDPAVSRAEAPVALLSAAAPLPTPETEQPTLPETMPTLAALPDAPMAAAKPPSLDSLAQQRPDNTAVPSATPDVTATKAVLAFPNVGEGAVDPASIAAFQSFTQPEAAGTMRDDLQSLLSLPCARMQVNFDPLTTTLQVSGHVPDASQRAPVLEALQAQMGGDIIVTDNLLVLPAPQCGALSGIAAVGLPQSTDQITNPLIVGDDTHARSFRYIKDDPLVLNLTAPDYPAYVYVDYFDADGNVIHLSPNVQAPLTATIPKEQLQIGARTRDEEGLMVIIGPPYGQEIAVAFAASVPLYQQERPLVEPAAPYLTWLQEQVAQTRAATPDFKGEWVYFFVQTAQE